MTYLCQDKILYSKHRVIRGFHTNTKNFTKSKLVSILKENIFDVNVDIRVGSPIFLKAISIELSEDNKKTTFCT